MNVPRKCKPSSSILIVFFPRQIPLIAGFNADFHQARSSARTFAANAAKQ